MAIRIKHKGTIIIRMIMRPQAWRAIVSPTGGKGCRMEGVDGRTVGRRKGHMRTSHHRIANTNPEERPPAHAISRSGLAIREKPLDAERLQGTIVKLDCAGQIAGSDRHMVEHGGLRLGYRISGANVRRVAGKTQPVSNYLMTSQKIPTTAT
jgi:hypothetical protein